VIETAIDYKTLYEESTLEIVSLKHEIDNLKRLIFGSKKETFIPQNIASSQLSLDIQAETIATCSVIKAQKIEYTRNQVESKRIIRAAPNFPNIWNAVKLLSNQRKKQKAAKR
jgi:hypothetical protein